MTINNETENEKNSEEVEYRPATIADFKLNKPFFVKDHVTSKMSQFTPSEGTGLAAQAVKFENLVYGGLAFVKQKAKKEAETSITETPPNP